MKNLVVLKNKKVNVGVKDSRLITCDTLNEVIYFATRTCVTGYNINTAQSSSFVSLVDQEYLEKGDDCIISLHYLLDEDSICIGTSKGDLLLWQPELNNLECAGSVDAGFTCVDWSPDQELLILTTGNGTLVVMTKDFDPLCEYPIHSMDFGEAEQVSVGWGKKETQFHGSAGKEAAKQKKTEAVTPVASWDDWHTEIAWRGDGQLFAITSVDESTNCRYVRIFDREGKLQATNEIIEGIENCLSWRPSGNLITCSQRKPNRHDVIFLEKNGLQHGEFTIPFKKDEKKILRLSWNMNSDILAVVLEDMQDSGCKTVQLWTTGNYHWYLKQEFNFKEEYGFASMAWDPEDCYVLHIITVNGIYTRTSFLYNVIQSRGVNNLSMVGVIDGFNLLLTPFKLMVMPPPMATHSVALDAPVNIFSFGVGIRQHDIIVSQSNMRFSLISYLPDGNYKNHHITMSDLTLTGNQIRHLTWFKEDLLAVVLDDLDGNSLCFLKLVCIDGINMLSLLSKILVPEDVLVLFLSEDEKQNLYLEDGSGNIYEVINEGESFSLSNIQITLPQPCCYVSCKHMGDKNLVFGLTNHFRLFFNTNELANNCTSFHLHDEFLLITTHSHTLRSIYLSSLTTYESLEKSKCFDESTRRVERGSKLITAVQSGTRVVLQMPRGNLESIDPRALTITHLQALLSNLEYDKVTLVMLKNRINLNLIFDHDPQLFLANIDKFIQMVPVVNHINLFLAEISEENVCTTLYHPYYPKATEHGCDMKITTKINLICDSIRKAIERNGNEKYLLALLTAYAKQSTPDLETVLQKIKELKDRSSTENEKATITYEKALSYVLYLVDVDQLFDIALGLYDFDIVIMVAEKSQKDPKEYLPFLNDFKKMEGRYRMFSIDKYLKKYVKALGHLVRCTDRLEECKEFVKDHKLYKEALKLYAKSSPGYKEMSYLYGGYLSQQKLYEDAGIIFSRSGYHEQALGSLLHTTNWQLALCEAKFLGYSEESLIKLARDFSGKLKVNHMFEEAAFLLEIYVKDIEESTVCLLEGGLWFRVMQLAHQYGREDLLETNLKPHMDDQYEQQVEKIEELSEKFNKHKDRLRVVVQKKEQEAFEILEGVRDDPENDLFSDTSSITGQSVSSVASSQGTRASGWSQKSRKKVGRKKYKLREGSKHEDYALKEALSEIVITADKMKEEVCGLLKILLYYHGEEQARNLQTIFTELLDIIEKNIKEIWSPEKALQTDNLMYGPDATVQSILDNRQNVSGINSKKIDDPVSLQPPLRTNVHWKIHLFRP